MGYHEGREWVNMSGGNGLTWGDRERGRGL